MLYHNGQPLGIHQSESFDELKRKFIQITPSYKILKEGNIELNNDIFAYDIHDFVDMNTKEISLIAQNSLTKDQKVLMVATIGLTKSGKSTRLNCLTTDYRQFKIDTKDETRATEVNPDGPFTAFQLDKTITQGVQFILFPSYFLNKINQTTLPDDSFVYLLDVQGLGNLQIDDSDDNDQIIRWIVIILNVAQSCSFVIKGDPNKTNIKLLLNSLYVRTKLFKPNQFKQKLILFSRDSAIRSMEDIKEATARLIQFSSVQDNSVAQIIEEMLHKQEFAIFPQPRLIADKQEQFHDCINNLAKLLTEVDVLPGQSILNNFEHCQQSLMKIDKSVQDLQQLYEAVKLIGYEQQFKMKSEILERNLNIELQQLKDQISFDQILQQNIDYTQILCEDNDEKLKLETDRLNQLLQNLIQTKRILFESQVSKFRTQSEESFCSQKQIDAKPKAEIIVKLGILQKLKSIFGIK